MLFCPSCSAQFSNACFEDVPHLLNCGHTVCGGCCSASALLPTPTCPVCNVNTIASAVNHGVAALIAKSGPDGDSGTAEGGAQMPCADCTALGLVSNVHGTAVCESCESCGGKKLCSWHAGPHRCAGHSVRNFRPAPSLLLCCTTHSDVIASAVCLDDGAAVCADCTVADHRGHAVVASSVDAVSRLGTLKQQCLQNAGVLAHGGVVEVSAAKEALSQRHASAVKDVNQAVDRAKATLDARRAAVLSSLEAEVRRRHKALDVQLDGLSVSASQLIGAAALCDATGGDALPALATVVRTLALGQQYSGPSVGVALDVSASAELKALPAVAVPCVSGTHSFAVGDALSNSGGAPPAAGNGAGADDAAAGAAAAVVSHTVPDVIVVDTAGAPVTCLSAADFSVTLCPPEGREPSDAFTLHDRLCARVSSVRQLTAGSYELTFTVPASLCKPWRATVLACAVPLCGGGSLVPHIIATLPDTCLSGSSHWANDANHHFIYSRLNGTRGAAAWCAATNDENQYIQVDLQQLFAVTQVMLQGRGDRGYPQRVTSYRIEHSRDGEHWSLVRSNHTTRDTAARDDDTLFPGCEDANQVVQNSAFAPFVARYVRVRPRTWWQHVSLRWDLSGFPLLPLGVTAAPAARAAV